MTFWKEIWKPLAAVSFSATFATALFHYVGIGPNRVSKKKEEEEALEYIPYSTSSENSKSVEEEVKK